MSIDFSLQKMKLVDVSSRNITHNVSRMWVKAGIYEDIYNSEGKKASEIVKNLKRGYAEMKHDKQGYSKLNPENGWGSYERALEFLKGLIEDCEEHPDAIIDISK